MLQFLWLTRLRERWMGKGVGRSRKRTLSATRSHRYRRLQLEALEDRLVLNSGVPTAALDPSVPGLVSPPPSPAPTPQITPSQPGAQPTLTGTWTAVKNAIPSGSAGTMILLPNGGVMVQGANDESVNTWYELKPDVSGSYANGSWTQLASSNVGRLFYGSVVLPSDQVFVLGGEYSGPSTSETLDNTGEIYNIANNTWTSIPNFPQPWFGDDPTIALPDGQILCGFIFGPQTYLYNPTTNAWSSGPNKLDNDRSDEESWVKLPVSASLPEGGVLSWSLFASLSSNTFMGQVYNIATGAWTETQNSTTNPPQLLSNANTVDYELGGALMLPNGNVFQIGANGNTAIYNPGTNTWSAGPQIIDNSGRLLGADDAPASILPDGQVVFSADLGPTSGFSPPTELFDYDYNTNTITQLTGLPSTLNNDLTNSSAYIDRTLVLPNGQLLFNDSTNLFLFTPSDSPLSAWRPSISAVVKTGANTYKLTGLQLNGISEGSSYGDDVNVSENYPIIKLTSSSNQVYYLTASNWSSVGTVSAVGDTSLESVNFTVPNTIANGVYQISVSANGISSLPQPLVIGLTAVKTVAQTPAPLTYNTSNQSVALSANVNVMSGSQTVNQGTVTFTLKDQNGYTVGTPVLGSVSGGVASVNYILPGGQAAGNYTVAVHYNDSLNSYGDGGDTNSTLTVSRALANTVATSVSTVYSPNKQTLALSANLASSGIPSSLINEGIVTFTITDSKANIVGTAQTAVSGGVASTDFVLPAGELPGSYSIAISYADAGGNFLDSGDTGATLTVSPAPVTTTANNVSAGYSLNGSQTLSLSASIAAANIPTDTVGEGVVTFTVTNAGTSLGTVTGNVSGGTASANFTLAAGQTAGNYTIGVTYGDSSGNFSDGGDTNGTLTVLPALVTTTAATPAGLIYSTADQTVNLSATVADDPHPTDIVKEGLVTFTIKSGNTIIGNAYADVSKGTAGANSTTVNTTFTLSGGRPVGTYAVDVSYSDSAGNFADSLADVNSTLTVGAASVTTAANNSPPIVSSSSAQSITLSANVTDTSFPNDVVKEGTVTFTVEDSGGNLIGKSVSGNVSGGTASAVFSVPAAQVIGTYTILASYSDQSGNFTDDGKSDSGGTFQITPANVSTTANSASTIYSPNGQSLTLTANLANTSVPTNTVGEGAVTFTIVDGKGNTIGTPIAGNVSGGTASASYNLPAGLAPGSYSINVNYSDTAGTGNFVDHGDTSATLTITPAKVTTKASSVAAVYSPNAQSPTLTAAVTDTSNSKDTVNEGTVTFTVTSGSTILGTAQATVTNGTASTNSFTLPAGQGLGTYSITVSYSDPSGNFIDNGDSGANLTITPANVTTTASSVSAVYSPKAQSLTLSAAVANTSISKDVVNEGTVTFIVTVGSTVVGSVQGTVANGTANASFPLPGGLSAGNYTITVSYNDITGHFLDAGDTKAGLVVNPAKVTATANNATAAYSPNSRTLALSASVADVSISTDTVSQGSVTFTILSATGPVASATGLVSGGKANASLSLPAGQAIGGYTIAVSYSDSTGNFINSGGNSAALSITPASVATTAGNVSAVYNLNAQTVALTATLTDTSVPSDVVTNGTVTFTIQNGGSTIGTVQGTVANGAANASFTLPAGLSAGSYGIVVSYNDSSGKFVDGGDTSGKLTITPASATATASSTSTTFSTGSQTLLLSAAVADPGPVVPNVVSEGVVTFTILSGSTPLGSVSSAVVGGQAHASFALPAGLNAGNYSIAVHYSDSSGNFADTGDTSATLAVGNSGTSTQLVAASFAPDYNNLTVTETVTAHVSSSSPVNRGTVTFQLADQTIPVNVDGNGNATLTLTLPMLTLLHPQAINISYADAGNNLIGSSSSGTASWQLSSPLFPSAASFAPNTVTADLFGLIITFTNGVLTEIDYNGLDLVFSYNASGQLSGIIFDGINLLA